MDLILVPRFQGVILACNSRVSDKRPFLYPCFSDVFCFFSLLPCSPIKVTAGPASGQPSVSNQSHEASCHRHSSAPSSFTVHSPVRWGNTRVAHTTSPGHDSTGLYLVILHLGNYCSSAFNTTSKLKHCRRPHRPCVWTVLHGQEPGWSLETLDTKCF